MGFLLPSTREREDARAILPGSFSEPSQPTFRKGPERAMSTESFPFLGTDFSIKLRKRPTRERGRSTAITIDRCVGPRHLLFVLRAKERGARRRSRGKIAFPGLYRHAVGRDDVRGEMHFNGDYGSRRYSRRAHTCRGWGKRRGRKKRKDERWPRGESLGM